MLNWKQTIYMFVALVLTIVCLCLPVATFHVPEFCDFVVMTNRTMTSYKGSPDLSVWPMFVALLLTCPITIFAIFLYKKKMLQARLCVFNIVLILLWMALCIYYVYTYQTKDEVCHIEMGLSHCLPSISLILYILARKGIIKDENRKGR